MLTGGRVGWFGRAREVVVGFFNPGMAGWLFILFFIILFAIMAPIALRIGKLFVRPIFWLYESRNYSVGLSLTGSVTPAVATIILAWLLRRRGRRVVPAIIVNAWFWVFAIIYVVFFGMVLPIASPTAAAVLLSLNTPMILAAPLIFIVTFGLARDVDEGDYWVAAEAYIALFTALLLSDLTTAVMAGVATETMHLFTKASLVIGGYGATDGLVLIPIEAAIAALITVTLITVVTVVVVKYLDTLKIVFKNALVNIGLSVLLLTGMLLGLKIIPYNLAGPVFGTAITLFATGLYNVTNYLSTTTTLNYELDAVPLSNDYSKGWVIIRVKNTGENVAEDAYALVSIKAREIGSLEEGYFPEKRHLGEFLDYRDLCGNLAIVNGNPRIENELLPWLLFPEGVAIKLSISPGHSGKLLVFEYERASDGYVIKVPSEGGVGKPRACLWLGFDIKYVFHITTYGKNVRRPLDVELYITMDKLDAITSYRTMSTPISLHFADGELLGKVFDMVLRELGNDGGITERAADLRMNIFYLVPSNKEKYLEEYLRVASGFETLWNELRNKFGPFAELLGSIFGVSYEYAVYLALAKRWDELTSFIRNNHLLSYCIDDVCVMTKLLLNLVITDKEFRERDIGHNFFDVHYNIYHMLERSFIYYIHIPGHFMPALARLLLGYEIFTCESECNYGEKGKFRDQKYYERRKQCYEDCKRMLNAFNGDEYAVYEIASELDSVLQRHWAYKNWVEGSSEKSAPPMLIKEIIDYVHNNEEPQDWGFFSKAVVELRLPTTSRLRFILILHNLLRAREEFEKGNIDEAIKFVDLAEAHAIIGTAKFDPLSFTSHFFDLFELFASDLKSKLKGSRRFEISDVDVLELLRLYHYHVETNIAETWP